MSRAFVKESDGWNYCRTKHVECSDAAFSGACERSTCKFPEEKKPLDATDKRIAPKVRSEQS